MAEAMRLGIDAGRALHGAGGVAVYVREVIRGLAAGDGNDEIVVFDLDGGVASRSEWERVMGPLPGNLRAASATREELRRIDVFHAPGFRMPPEGAAHHLFTVHDLTFLSHPEYHTIDNRVRSLAATATALARGAVIHSVSAATRREIERILGVASSEVEVVPPMLDPVFAPAPDRRSDGDVIRRLGIAPSFVLAVGSLEPRKNFERLLDAWMQVSATLRSGHQVVVVSAAGWLQTSLRRRLHSLVRSGAGAFVGPLGPCELAALYRRAGALVFPSLAEGFGLPVAEAMACGTPVITSDRSSLPEVAGEAALLVDPEDPLAIAEAIEQVLSDSRLAAALRDRGIDRARRFSRLEVLPQLLAAYHRAAERG